MSKQTYNYQEIMGYLLGSLSETETERLDELSMTDDEVADAVSAAENDLIDAYVQGELTGASLEKFQSHYLASPLRREKVKFAEAFKHFADKNVSSLAAEAGTKAAPTTFTKRGFSFWSFLTAPRAPSQWGFAAASLMLLIIAGLIIYQNIRLRQQVSQTQSMQAALEQKQQQLQREGESQRLAVHKAEQELARLRAERDLLEKELGQRAAEQAKQNQALRPGGIIASFVLSPQLRGVGQIPVVSFAADTDNVAMRLNLEPTEYLTYKAELINQSNNQTLWRSRQLKARATVDGKALNVRFRASLLRPQAYLFRVKGVSANGASEVVGDYPFRVVKN